jgi:hypothetical protein
MVEWKRERYRRDSVCGDLSSAVICHRIVADSPVDLKHSYQVNYRLVLPRDARNVICSRIDQPADLPPPVCEFQKHNACESKHDMPSER